MQGRPSSFQLCCSQPSQQPTIICACQWPLAWDWLAAGIWLLLPKSPRCASLRSVVCAWETSPSIHSLFAISCSSSVSFNDFFFSMSSSRTRRVPPTSPDPISRFRPDTRLLPCVTLLDNFLDSFSPLLDTLVTTLSTRHFRGDHPVKGSDQARNTFRRNQTPNLIGSGHLPNPFLSGAGAVSLATRRSTSFIRASRPGKHTNSLQNAKPLQN